MPAVSVPAENLGVVIKPLRILMEPTPTGDTTLGATPHSYGLRKA